MSDDSRATPEASLHYWLRIYKKNHRIAYQVMLNEEFGQTFDQLTEVEMDGAVYHIMYSRRFFKREQLVAAVHWFHHEYVEPLLRLYPKKADAGHAYRTVKERKGS